MSVTSIPVAAFRYTADGSQAIAETVRIRSAVESLNDSPLDDIIGQFNDLDLSVEGLAGKIAGFASAGALLGFIKQGADLVNQLGTAAQRAGTTAESLSKLKFVAEESDVSFEALTSGIRKFQDGLSEASSGQGALADAFKELGLSAQSLRGQDLEIQLGKVADAFGLIADQGDRVRISNQLFGRSSEELILLLDQGSAGINQLSQRAEDLGLVLDNRATAAVDRGTKAIERLGRVATGVFARVAQQIALTLTDSGDEALETQAKLEELQRTLARQTRELSLSPGNDTLRIKLQQTREEIEKILGPAERLRKTVEGLGFGDISTAIPEISAPKFQVDDTQERKAAEDEMRQRQEFENLLIEQRGDIERGAAETQKQLAKEVSDNLEDELKRRADMEQNNRDAMAAKEQAFQDQILAIRRQGVSAAQVLLTAYGGKFAAVGKAILLVEKALAIKATFINTREAIMKTFAKYGGTPIGYASAAAIAVLGAAQIAAIAAQGTSGGGGATSGGSIGSAQRDTAPGFDPVTDPTQPFVNQSQPTVSQIIIQGSVFSSRETADFIIQQIRDAVDKRDVVIIGNDSRQMQEIMRR